MKSIQSMVRNPFVPSLDISEDVSMAFFLFLVGRAAAAVVRLFPRTDLSKEWNCMGSMGWVLRAGSGWKGVGPDSCPSSPPSTGAATRLFRISCVSEGSNVVTTGRPTDV